MDNENTKPKGKEYFYFRCPQGHENYINPGQKEIEERNNQVIVHCQTCNWQSPPFTPKLFQSHSGGDMLLWVYTTKDIGTVNSVINVNVNEQPFPFDRKPAPAPKENTDKAQEDKSATPLTKKETPKIPDEEKKEVQNFLEQKPEKPEKTSRPHTVRIQRVKPEEIPTPLQPDKEKQGSTVKAPAKSLKETEVINVNRIKELAKTAEIRKPVSPAPPPTEQKKSPPAVPATTNIQVRQSTFSLFLVHLLWMFIVIVVLSIGATFFQDQTGKVTQALNQLDTRLEHLKLSPVIVTKQGTSQDNQNNTQSDPKLAKINESLRQNIDQKQQALTKRNREYKALQFSYRQAQKSQQNLKQQLNNSQAGQQKLEIDYRKLQKKFSTLIAAYTPRHKTIELSKKDEDFHIPTSGLKGRAILYHRDKEVRRKVYQRSLQFVALENDRLLQQIPLFKTQPVKEKIKDIPFVFDWDGDQNIVLLTRVLGKNNITYFNLKASKNSAKANKRTLVSVKYPQVLGPPSLSPDGQYVAFIHKDGEKHFVKIYKHGNGRSIASIEGGGDTLRAPAWSPDSRYLFFLGKSFKSIVAWKFPQNKRVKSFPREIFGRYLSCSPDGKYVAFFVKSIEGKGKVQLYLWNWQSSEGQVEIVDHIFRTSENCQPQWRNKSRYIAFIESAEKDKVLLRDNATREIYTLFERTGKIEWLSWRNKDLLFSYREGLFARPFIIRFSGPQSLTKN